MRSTSKRVFSPEFLVDHFLAIFGVSSGAFDGVAAAAAGIDQRLGWWSEIIGKLTADRRQRDRAPAVGGLRLRLDPDPCLRLLDHLDHLQQPSIDIDVRPGDLTPPEPGAERE